MSDSLTQWMAAVASIAKALNTDKPLPAVLTKVSQQTCELIGFDYCAVMLAEETGQRLVIHGSAALTANYVRQVNSGHVPILVHPPEPSSDTPAARAFRAGRTVALPDVEDTNELQPFRELIVEQGYRAIVAAPLCSGGSPVGVLVGYSANPRTFTDSEIELVNLFADQASLAIRNAQLRDGEQRIITELNRQQERAEWVERQDRKLMRLLVADVGLAGVVASLAESLDASVTLQDSAGRVLAAVGQPPPAGELAEVVRARAELEVVRVDLDGKPAWVAPVALSGELVAMLWVISAQADPDPVQGSIIERFSLMVALELVKERHATATELRLSRDLVSDLLDSRRGVGEQTLLERGKALGHDLGVAHTLVLLSVRLADTEQRYATLARAFERAVAMVRASSAGPVLASVRREELVLLVPEDGEGLADTVQRVRAELAQRVAGEVTAVIGDTVHQLDRYPTAYRVARGAADLAGNAQLLRVADLGLWALLLESGTPAALRELADRLLAPIEEQDRLRGTGLCETLRAWLRHDCSTAAAAEDLVVHPNTVSYRLNRIEQLCGRSLKSHDTLVQFHTALTIRAVEGG